jgi:predicted HicB family RNase H-like nuclease
MAREATTHEDARQLKVRVPPDMHAAIKKLAEREDLTIAQMVRRLLKQRLEDANVA